MNFFDLIFSILIVGFLFKSVKEPLIAGGIKTFALLTAYLVAERSYHRVFDLLLPYFNQQNLAKSLAFLGIVLAGAILGSILGRLSQLLFFKKASSWPLRIIKAATGMIRGTVWCLVAYFVVRNLFFAYVDDLEGSFYDPLIGMIREWIVGFKLA